MIVAHTSLITLKWSKFYLAMNQVGADQQRSPWLKLAAACVDKPNVFLEKRFYDQTKTKIALFGHNDKSFVWRSKCGAFKPKNTSQAAKHGALGLFCSQ